MHWWDDLVAWFQTETGRVVFLGGVVPFVAILVSGLLAAAIARGSVKRLLLRHDREAKAATIGLLVDAARQSSMWGSSSASERTLIERAVAEADLALRLLPVTGAPAVAEWAASEIAGFRRGSVTFSREFDIPLAEFRDRLIEWYRAPRRARNGFARDLTRWRAEEAAEDRRLREQVGESDEGDGTGIDATVASPSVSAHAFEHSTGSAHAFEHVSGHALSGPLAGTETTSVEPLRSFRPVEKPNEPGQVESPFDDDFARPVPAFRGGARAPEAPPEA